ncbi:TCR/Tet family MFS transporter [Aquilutibacter rugosus]|uniref:TCR/Tet family MFS transporter n=1 Tax=Aquilutibacter rugosus TaxID=3115820 RepID=UPI002F41CD5B
MTALSPITGSRRQAALIFIFITVLIDVIAFGVIIPVLPQLIKDFVGGSDATASHWIGIFGTLFAAIQFVSAPIQGALSDRYGRRPVILLSCLGLGLDFILMALAPNLTWLLVGRCISAVTSASFTTANAYIADVTEPEQRAKSFGMIGAAFGIGFILGPAIGGTLGAHNLHWPFWFAAGLALLNGLYGLFVLPESLAPEHRSKNIQWGKANPIGSFALLGQYRAIWPLAAIILIANLAHYIYPTIFVLYADYRYGWGPQQVAAVLVAVGVSSVVVNGFAVGRITRRLGERRAMVLGLTAGALGFALYGLATQGWIFWLGIPISALWALSGPAAQAIITRSVGKDVQGRIQGSLSSLVSLAGIGGPLLFSGVFSAFISQDVATPMPGAPWYLAAILLAVAVLIAVQYARVEPSSAD